MRNANFYFTHPLGSYNTKRDEIGSRNSNFALENWRLRLQRCTGSAGPNGGQDRVATIEMKLGSVTITIL